MAAILAANLGRLEEAIALIQRAAVLDPLSVPTHKFVGLFALSAGRLEEAAIALKTAIELNPQAGFNHLWLGVVRLTQGRLDEALGAVEQEVHSSMRLLGLALVQYSRRWLEESEATLWNLIEQDAAGSAYQRGGSGCLDRKRAVVKCVELRCMENPRSNPSVKRIRMRSSPRRMTRDPFDELRMRLVYACFIARPPSPSCRSRNTSRPAFDSRGSGAPGVHCRNGSTA
jgi:hypothetical protein